MEEVCAVPFRAAMKKLRHRSAALLHLDDSAHSIALGVGIGMFIAITPTWGIQMVLVVGVAWLLRANKTAGIPMVWITNPITNVPIYSFCYIIGHALVGGPGLGEVRAAFAGLSNADLGWGGLARSWLDLMWHAAAPLWVGCTVVGLAAGGASYAVAYYFIACYRRRHPHGASASSPAADGGGPEAPAPPGRPASPGSGTINSEGGPS
jgi:uncharacterized protein (DUF2062 family)